MFFFFNDTATTEIYTLSLHDALPIWGRLRPAGHRPSLSLSADSTDVESALFCVDRKSTRLNSSHANISYAVFCLKKKQNSTALEHHLPTRPSRPRRPPRLPLAIKLHL